MDKIKSLRNIIGESLALLEIISSNSKLEIVSKEELNSIKNLYGELGYYNFSMPRVFLMGEFKAGKSSLVNTILKKNYAPIDILEMTSWVSKFWSSDSDYCKINFNDNTSAYPNLFEFLTNCQNRNYEADYFKKIKTVEIGIKDLENNYIIIDTPGFGSINFANEKKLIELLYEADIILFTIDAESIGSMKEAAIINEYIKKGIPYFVVITKIDLIENQSEVEEIKNFVHREYNAEYDKIYAVSFDRTCKYNEINMLENKLYDYAQNFNSDSRLETEYGFLKIISDRLILFFNDVEKAILDIHQRIEKFNSYIDALSSTIGKSIQLEIEEYAKKILLQNKRQKLIVNLSAILSKNKGSISEEEILNVLQENLGKDFLEYAYKKINIELLKIMKQHWVSYLEEIEIKSSNVFEGLLGNKNITDITGDSISKVGDYDILIDQLTKKTFARGMKGTLGFAGVLTAYAAWFGPAAASVTLPMALTGVGIPLAVIGAGISGLMAYKKRNQMKDMIDSYAAGILDNIVVKIVDSVMKPNFEKVIKSLNNNFVDTIKNQFYNDSLIGMDDSINLKRLRQLLESLKKS